MAVNTYYLKARLFPTLLTSAPIIWGYNMYVSKLYSEKLANIHAALPEITNTLLSGAIIFLLVQANRFLAKEVVQNVFFSDELSMPTTNFLLKSDTTLEKSIKKKIEDKIQKNYGINLYSAALEMKDQSSARKVIVTAVSQIKNTLRKNSMLFQHNIEYGFIRNLIGGSILAFIIGIAICMSAHMQADYTTERTAYIAIGVYSVPLILSRFLMTRYGKDYAKILYEQFLTK